MDYTQLATPKELIAQYPATSKHQQFIAHARAQIQRILEGEDQRLLLIVGPCSIHNLDSASKYALRLKELTDHISDQFFIVMRSYLEKPRTTTGWTGFLNDPYLNGSYDIDTGLRQGRRFLLSCADLELPCGMEFLSLSTPQYLGDLISWGCIGARTTSSQPHRQLASGLPMPIGFKNGTNGDICIANHGIATARSPHRFIGTNPDGYCSAIKTEGNAHAHLVLRGGIRPNYDQESVQKAIEHLDQAHLPKHLLIDCSHDNSRKEHERQLIVFRSVIEQRQAGNDAIAGILLESHLNAGSQRKTQDGTKIDTNSSWTDPCIDWQTTEQLLTWAYEKLKVYAS